MVRKYKPFNAELVHRLMTISGYQSAVMNLFNLLMAFIPITLVLERLDNMPPPVVFFSAALAIVPIARLIVLGTEQLAWRTGDAIGGLLNGTNQLTTD